MRWPEPGEKRKVCQLRGSPKVSRQRLKTKNPFIPALNPHLSHVLLHHRPLYHWHQMVSYCHFLIGSVRHFRRLHNNQVGAIKLIGKQVDECHLNTFDLDYFASVWSRRLIGSCRRILCILPCYRMDQMNKRIIFLKAV